MVACKKEGRETMTVGPLFIPLRKDGPRLPAPVATGTDVSYFLHSMYLGIPL